MQCWKQLFASIRKRLRHTRVFENSLPKHNRNNMGFVELRCEKKETYIHRWEIFARRRRIPYLLWILSQTDLDRAQRGRCSKCGLNPCRVKGSWPTCCTTTHPRENVQSSGSARQLRHSNRNEDHQKEQQKNAVFTRRTVLHTRVKKQHDASKYLNVFLRTISPIRRYRCAPMLAWQPLMMSVSRDPNFEVGSEARNL